MAKNKKRIGTPKLFSTDVSYLEAELAWVEFRTRLVTARRELQGKVAGQRGKRNSGSSLSACELREGIQRLHCEEQGQRKRIDDRMDLHCQMGKPLGLDRLQQAHGLSGIERGVLVLGAVPALDPALARSLENLDDAWGHGVTLRVVSSFLEHSLEQQIKARQVLSPGAPLLAADLINADHFDRRCAPADLVTNPIEITEKAFSVLIGSGEFSL